MMTIDFFIALSVALGLCGAIFVAFTFTTKLEERQHKKPHEILPEILQWKVEDVVEINGKLVRREGYWVDVTYKGCTDTTVVVEWRGILFSLEPKEFLESLETTSNYLSANRTYHKRLLEQQTKETLNELESSQYNEFLKINYEESQKLYEKMMVVNE